MSILYESGYSSGDHELGDNAGSRSSTLKRMPNRELSRPTSPAVYKTINRAIHLFCINLHNYITGVAVWSCFALAFGVPAVLKIVALRIRCMLMSTPIMIIQ